MRLFVRLRYYHASQGVWERLGPGTTLLHKEYGGLGPSHCPTLLSSEIRSEPWCRAAWFTVLFCCTVECEGGWGLLRLVCISALLNYE